MAERLKIAIYGRYSSENQHETSIDAQIRACTEYANKKGYIIVEIYTDKALTGTDDKRPAFKQMLDDSDRKKFDAVLVHKFDRFARDTLLHDQAKAKLKSNGVSLISVLEPLDNSPEAVIAESIYKGFAEYYSLNLSREVKKGNREKLEKIINSGKAVNMGGHSPFGYNYDSNGYYQINQHEAQIVKRIFDLYTSGAGYKAIRNDLIQRGYTNRQGKTITICHIRNIVQYEQYTGVFIYKSNPTNDLYRKNKRYLKSKMSITRIEGAIPQIITQEVYQMASAKIATNNRQCKEKKAVEPYLLTGIIRCAKCGAVMIGNRTGDAVYYVCPERKRSASCDMPAVKRNDIEECVLNYIEMHFTADKIEAFIDLIDAKKTEYANSNTALLDDYNKRLKGITKQIDFLIEEIMQGRANDQLRAKMDELDKEKAIVKANISRLENDQASATLPRDFIEKYINSLKDIRAKTRQEQQRIIKSAITSVKVDAKIEEGNKKPTFYAEITSIFGKMWAENWYPQGCINSTQMVISPLIKALYIFGNSFQRRVK